MKNKSILFVIVLSFFFICCIKYDRSKVKLGVVLPLTGNAAIYGKDLKNGIDLAYKQSDLKTEIQLIYEDDAGDTKTGVNATMSLINKDVDFVIGGIMSSVASAILPITNSNKVLLLSPKATSLTLSKEDDYFFRIWPSDDYDGNIMAEFLFDSLKVKTVAVLYVNLDYGVGLKTIFENKFKDIGGDVVFSEGFDNNRNDFRTTILKIKEANPEALFMPAYYKEAVKILKQLNENACDFTIIGTSAFYENEVKLASGGLAEKSYFAYPLYSPDNDDIDTKQFVSEFKKEYDEIPNAFCAHGYDSFKLLETAIKNLKNNKQKISPDAIKTYLENFDNIKGVTGNYHFDDNGDVVKDLRILKLSEIFNE